MIMKNDKAYQSSFQAGNMAFPLAEGALNEAKGEAV